MEFDESRSSSPSVPPTRINTPYFIKSNESAIDDLMNQFDIMMVKERTSEQEFEYLEDIMKRTENTLMIVSGRYFSNDIPTTTVEEVRILMVLYYKIYGKIGTPMQPREPSSFLPLLQTPRSYVGYNTLRGNGEPTKEDIRDRIGVWLEYSAGTVQWSLATVDGAYTILIDVHTDVLRTNT